MSWFANEEFTFQVFLESVSLLGLCEYDTATKAINIIHKRYDNNQKAENTSSQIQESQSSSNNTEST